MNIETTSQFNQVYQSIMDTAVDGIIVIDNKGIIKIVNHAVKNLFEYTDETLIGSNVSILMNNHDRSHHDQYLHNYNTTKIPKIIDGQLLFTGILHDITSLKESQSKLETLNKELDAKVIERTFEVEKVVNQLLSVNKALNTEIDEKNKVEKELLKAQRQLQEALSKEKELNQLKSSFITTVSHEFRTPLASILSSAALIASYSQESQLEKRLVHVDKIKKAANNLTGLLNDVLSLSKVEEGLVMVQSEPFDVVDICHQIINELSPLFKTNQEIKFTYSLSNDQLFDSDAKLVKNIIFNVVSNALKYSQKDVLLHVLQDNDAYIVTIRDEGIGIPALDQEQLFSRFYRASNVGHVQGTGLGLHIVKRYCDMIGALIQLESEVDQFTLITLTLNPYHG
jgi:two-component system, LuxR family, sensor kinase FixL